MTGFRKDKQTEADKQAGTEKFTGRQTDKERGKHNQSGNMIGWLVGSVLQLLASMGGCFD